MSAPLMLRVLSASVAAANRAGNIIREVMSTGKLGVVDKVSRSVNSAKEMHDCCRLSIKDCRL